MFTYPDQPMQRGRLQKCLDTKYNWGHDRGGIMTLGEYLVAHPPVAKRKAIREYSNTRVHLAYVKLRTPKVEYTVILDADTHRGIDVPKVVYDALASVPEWEPIGSF